MESIPITHDEYRSVLDAAYTGHNWMKSFRDRGNEILATKHIEGSVTGASHSGDVFTLCYVTEPVKV